MSWAGFKKNVNRATTQVMMKTGKNVFLKCHRGVSDQDMQATWSAPTIEIMRLKSADTAPWNQPPTGSRKKRKDIWIV